MAEIVRPTWMTNEMWSTWLGLYLDAGGEGVPDAPQRATAMFREDARYGTTWFPGIKTDDGTLRYTETPEMTYESNIRSFQNTVEGIGIAPGVFDEEYIDLIKGDTSPNEFSQRVTALQDRVIGQGPAIRDFYAANYGIDFSNEGIIASLMSERVDTAILDRQITMSEIAGEGISRGFDISAEFSNLLATEGQMNRDEAQKLFGSAEAMLPILSGLAKRHGDPDDDFDITEFADAQALYDPEQLSRLDRLQAQEQSLFTGGGQLDFTREQDLRRTGLAERS